MSKIYEEVDPGFAVKCSDVTLCSHTKGFFRELVDEMASLADKDDWIQTLEKLPEAEKIAAVLDNKEVMGAMTEVLSRIQPLYRGKDPKVSQERLQVAKAALDKGDLKDALTLVTQAIFKSPPAGLDDSLDGGATLAMSLWLRSEVLLKMDRPQAALEDLKMALKERLPAKMRPSYYWRMGHCYKGIGEASRAKVSYELAARLLSSDEEATNRLAKDIANLDYSVQPKQPTEKPRLLLTAGAKPNAPSLSKLLKIAEEGGKGRYAVANARIRTGDVLLVDSPYAACLLPDFFGTHCQHCFKRIEDCIDTAPVWCPRCSGVVFCSAQCRDTAASYHSHECQFLDLFIGSGMSVLSFIALRMVTQAGLETSMAIHSKHLSGDAKTVEGTALNDIEGVAKKFKMKSRKERLNRSRKGLKSLSEKVKEEDIETKEDKMNIEETIELKAAQIYSLCTHSEQRKGEDYLKRIIMGLFLTECLKKVGFFKTCEADNKVRAETSICALIVKNLQLLQFNAHEIYETVRGDHPFSGSKPVYIAVGIYPTGALFNHECYPAVARYFDGRNVVLRATRPLAPGDVVSENYGPHFMMRGLKERQRVLACRYWFRCECTACVEDWPTMQQLTSNTPPYLRCDNADCSYKFRANMQSLPNRCPKCSTAIESEIVKAGLDTIQKCIDLYQKGAHLMDEGRTEDATSAMCDGIDLYHEIARPPHRDTHLAQESLRSCFAAAGNVHIVPAKDIAAK